MLVYQINDVADQYGKTGSERDENEFDKYFENLRRFRSNISLISLTVLSSETIVSLHTYDECVATIQ